MSNCVSRRNRRKTVSQIARSKREFILLCISLAVFFGALTCFAWAVPARSSPQNPESPSPAASSHAPSGTQESTYTGNISSGQNQNQSSQAGASSTSTSSSSASAANSASPPGTSVQEPASQAEHTTDSGSSSAPDAQSGYVEQVEEVEYSEVQSYHVVHHSAYQAIPVYATLHHQASTPKEVTVNGVTRIEWTTCPVCGQRHNSAFNERVVDHVNEAFCTACGMRHDNAFDEVVYD